MKLFNPTEADIMDFVIHDENGSFAVSLLAGEIKEFPDSQGAVLREVYGFLEEVDSDPVVSGEVKEIEQQADGTITILGHKYKVIINEAILAKYRADAIKTIKGDISRLHKQVGERKAAAPKPKPAAKKKIKPVGKPVTPKADKKMDKPNRDIDIPSGVDKDGVEWVGEGIEVDTAE